MVDEFGEFAPTRGRIPPDLSRYWTRGAGAAKIRWATPGDFGRCVRLLRKYFPDNPEGLCNHLHTRALGAPPGKGHAMTDAEVFHLQGRHNQKSHGNRKTRANNVPGKTGLARAAAKAGTPDAPAEPSAPGVAKRAPRVRKPAGRTKIERLQRLHSAGEIHASAGMKDALRQLMDPSVDDRTAANALNRLPEHEQGLLGIQLGINDRELRGPTALRRPARLAAIFRMAGRDPSGRGGQPAQEAAPTPDVGLTGRPMPTKPIPETPDQAVGGMHIERGYKGRGWKLVSLDEQGRRYADDHPNFRSAWEHRERVLKNRKDIAEFNERRQQRIAEQQARDEAAGDPDALRERRGREALEEGMRRAREREAAPAPEPEAPAVPSPSDARSTQDHLDALAPLTREQRAEYVERMNEQDINEVARAVGFRGQKRDRGRAIVADAPRPKQPPSNPYAETSNDDLIQAYRNAADNLYLADPDEQNSRASRRAQAIHDGLREELQRRGLWGQTVLSAVKAQQRPRFGRRDEAPAEADAAAEQDRRNAEAIARRNAERERERINGGPDVVDLPTGGSVVVGARRTPAQARAGIMAPPPGSTAGRTPADVLASLRATTSRDVAREIVGTLRGAELAAVLREGDVPVRSNASVAEKRRAIVESLVGRRADSEAITRNSSRTKSEANAAQRAERESVAADPETQSPVRTEAQEREAQESAARERRERSAARDIHAVLSDPENFDLAARSAAVTNALAARRDAVAGDHPTSVDRDRAINDAIEQQRKAFAAAGSRRQQDENEVIEAFEDGSDRPDLAVKLVDLEAPAPNLARVRRLARMINPSPGVRENTDAEAAQVRRIMHVAWQDRYDALQRERRSIISGEPEMIEDDDADWWAERYETDPDISRARLAEVDRAIAEARKGLDRWSDQGRLVAHAGHDEEDRKPMFTPWHGPLAPLDRRTGDRRRFAPGSLSNRELPVALRWQERSAEGHSDAVVVGGITNIEYAGNGEPIARGYFLDTDLFPDAAKAMELVRLGIVGPSVDLDEYTYELRNEDGSDFDADAFAAATEAGDKPSKPESWVTEGRIAAATLVSIAAFDALRIKLGEPQESAELALVAAALDCGCEADDDCDEDGEDFALDLFDLDELEPLTAAAGWTAPSADVFVPPKLSGPTPLTVTADGRVYGHLAPWGQCHVGYSDCRTAPSSRSNYAYFHTGTVACDDGTTVPVGRLMIGAKHADPRAGFRQSAQHYDETGRTVALVRASEDEHGIVFAGVVVADLDAQTRAQFMAHPLSGDWRSIGGSLELIGAVSVPVPGFPVARVENGQPMTLVASAWHPVSEVDEAEFAELTSGLFAAELEEELSAWAAIVADERAALLADIDA